MKLLDIVSICVAVILPVQAAAEGVDLASLQQTALANRHVIQKYEAQLEKSVENRVNAQSGYYPSLDLSYIANSLDEASLYEYRENSAASGRVSWNIFAGFRDKYTIASADLLHSAEQYKLQGIKQDIKLQVAMRYLAIYNWQANLQVAEDSYSTLLKLYEDTENRFAVGLIKKSELLKFKVDLDHAQINRERVKAGLEKSILFLQREIDAPVDGASLLFSEFSNLPSLAGYTQHEEIMLEKRSEIKALEEAMGAAELAVKAEKAAYYPRVDLVGSYSRYDDDYLPGNGDRYDEELRAQLVLSMNLFDGFGKKSRVSAARLEAQTIRYDLDELKRDLVTLLKNLFLDYDVNTKNVEVAFGSIKQAEENLRVTRLSYQEGITPEFELLEAISDLSRAQSNYVTAKSEVFADYFQIIRAVEDF